MFFWDKLNKANYYLELAIENADLPIDDRVVDHLAKGLISDGGQWDMAVNLLEVIFVAKSCGICAETLMTELRGRPSSTIS